MPGDTATSIASALTRDPQGWRGSGFQILDPAAARLVPKASTGYLRRGWQACLVEPRPTSGVGASTGTTTGGCCFLWLRSRGIAVVAPSSLVEEGGDFLACEKFGAAFIREFERPLIDARSSRPVLRAQAGVVAG